MGFGNMVGSFFRDTVIPQISNAGNSIDQMSGEAFSNPSKAFGELKTVLTFAITNKVVELASSSVIILGSGVGGIVLAKKAYSHDKSTWRNVAVKTVYGVAALASLAIAGFELYSLVSGTRLNGRCVNYYNTFEANYGRDGSPGRENSFHSYRNEGCQTHGKLVR